MIGVLFAGYDEKKGKDDIVYLGVNVYWEALGCELPGLPEGFRWKIAVNTGAEGSGCYQEPAELSETGLLMGPRSVVVLTGEKIY